MHLQLAKNIHPAMKMTVIADCRRGTSGTAARYKTSVQFSDENT